MCHGANGIVGCSVNSHISYSSPVANSIVRYGHPGPNNICLNLLILACLLLTRTVPLPISTFFSPLVYQCDLAFLFHSSICQSLSLSDLYTFGSQCMTLRTSSSLPSPSDTLPTSLSCSSCHCICIHSLALPVFQIYDSWFQRCDWDMNILLEPNIIFQGKREWGMGKRESEMGKKETERRNGGSEGVWS